LGTSCSETLRNSDVCNGKDRRIGTGLSHSGAMNVSVVQLNVKKRKENFITQYDSGIQSLEVKGGAFASGIIDRRSLRMESGVFKSATKDKRSNLFAENEIKNSSGVADQIMPRRALERYVVQSSCSSVSSAESHTKHDFVCRNEHGLLRPVTSDKDAKPGAPFTNARDNGVSLGQNSMDVHALELHAYRSVLRALRACGPLNWQRETLLTDLRLSLNISNDEHRLELAHVCTSQNS